MKGSERMLDLIDMYYQCEEVPCTECEHSEFCSMAWIYEMYPVEEHFYSIHYAEGEV